MGEFCKECYKKYINPNATDDYLQLTDHPFLCEGCACLRPVVVGEGWTDKIGGWHTKDCGYSPYDKFCPTCNKTTCEGCEEAFTYENTFVACDNCLISERCTNRTNTNGCNEGISKMNHYYHIRPVDDGCVVLAYDSQNETLYQQVKGKDNNDTIILPTKQAAINWIKYSTILNEEEKSQIKPEYFFTASERAKFTPIIKK